MIVLEPDIMGSVAAGIVAFIIGFAWYGPLFGKQWMQYMGLKQESMKKEGMMPAMIGGLVTAIVSAGVLSIFISATGVADIAGALAVGFLVWVGFFLTTGLGIVLWEQKPIGLYFLNAGHHLVTLLVMIAVIFIL